MLYKNLVLSFFIFYFWKEFLLCSLFSSVSLILRFLFSTLKYIITWDRDLLRWLYQIYWSYSCICTYILFKHVFIIFYPVIKLQIAGVCVWTCGNYRCSHTSINIASKSDAIFILDCKWRLNWLNWLNSGSKITVTLKPSLYWECSMSCALIDVYIIVHKVSIT